ncbi:MAG: HAD-IIIA family hydrolase [Proteobacteria bacterium]|nr:HAD-IIIA family hydrolase [Pseudomonadota bacterium]
MLVLIDRDGVLNIERPGYVETPGQLELLPGAAAAVGRLNQAGISTALITNQSVVGRKRIDGATLEKIHARLQQLLAAEKAHLDMIVCCTDPPWAPTARRKPNPGMLWEAIRAAGTFPPDTVMIGDDLRDIQAAARAGCRRILVRTGKGREVEAAGLPHHLLPLVIRDDLASAVDYLLEQRP